MAPAKMAKKRKDDGLEVSDDEDGVMRKEVRKKEKEMEFIKVILKYAFSQVGVVVLCTLYAVGGAQIYLGMELPLEEERRAAKQEVALEIINMEDFLSGAFWTLIHHQYPEKRYNQTAFEDKVSNDLHQYVGKIVAAAGDHNYDGEVDTWDYDWTLPNALLFTVTIMTTVGYGHISPKSATGQLFTIVYALIGMPLLMMFLGNVGNLFGDGIKYTYSRICCRWCRAKRRASERLPGQSLRDCKKIIDDDIGKEEYMPTDEIAIPIILCVLIILGFLSFGSVLYHFWEGWDFISAAYFCFITMSTIGFGDMVPSESFLNYQESMYGKFQMVVCTSYIMLGLACLATAISLIQEGLMLKAEKMKNKMGLGKAAKVRFDDVSVRERVYRDSSGYFVGLDGADTVDKIEIVAQPDEESSRPSTARTDIPDGGEEEEDDDGDIPGQVDNEDNEDEAGEDDGEEEEETPEDEDGDAAPEEENMDDDM